MYMCMGESPEGFPVRSNKLLRKVRWTATTYTCYLDGVGNIGLRSDIPAFTKLLVQGQTLPHECKTIGSVAVRAGASCGENGQGVSVGRFPTNYGG